MRDERVLLRDAGIVVSRLLSRRCADLTEGDLLDEADNLVRERVVAAAAEDGLVPLPQERVRDMAAALAAVAKSCLDETPLFVGRR